MNTTQVTNVVAAFEILLEQIETEIDLLNRLGASAFSKREYDTASRLAERGKSVTTFRQKIAALRREWETIAISKTAVDEDDEEIQAERRNLGRLQRGLRTPEEAYYEPVLKVLVDFGGAGKLSDVLPQVEQLMRSTLSPVDYEPLASDKDVPRWRNAAQWARLTLVREGFMKPDSPRGLWEITEEGRRRLLAVANATDA